MVEKKQIEVVSNTTDMLEVKITKELLLNLVGASDLRKKEQLKDFSALDILNAIQMEVVERAGLKNPEHQRQVNRAIFQKVDEAISTGLDKADFIALFEEEIAKIKG